jgi:hypothetical protein
MANLLQSSQTQATTAPSYYTDYLSNLAGAGTNAVQNAQYVGAQPLQQQAFTDVSQNAGTFQPAISQAEQLAQSAGNQNITGAASPYLSAATGSSPLSAMSPYVNQATGYSGAQAGQPLISQGVSMSGLDAASPYFSQATQSPADLASQYMNPYVNTVVQNLQDMGQRNIQQNLAPSATAAAVGSGQYGSKRGAEVAGQTQANAQRDLSNQISQLMSTGYGQALTAAGQQNQLLGTLGQYAGNLTNTQAQNAITGGTNLGQLQQGQNTIASNLASTASNAQNAQNQANLTAGQTASQAAANQAQAQNTAAQNMGTLAQTGQGMSLADINALSTLGQQQQTIEQNKQLFPLNNLSTLSGMLRGYNVPTTTTTQLTGSPLSALAAIGSGAKGLFDATGTNGTGLSLYDQIKKAFGSDSTPPPSNGGDNSGGGGGGGGGTSPQLYPHINPEDGSTYYTEEP